jgi:hypothetical protein
MPNTIAVWAPWMHQKEPEAIIDQINLMPIYHRKPNARVLGERLRVTNWERERLKLWTIAPCDMGEHGMDWWRKRKKRERMRELRRLRGQKTRAEYLVIHKASKEQPWIALGISRRTYYYRLKSNDCTSPCQVKLNKSTNRPVQPHKPQVSKKEESAERNQSVSSITPTPQSDKPEMLVTDTANELLAPTCAINNAEILALMSDPQLLGHTCDSDTATVPELFGHNGGPAMDELPATPEQDLRGMPRDLSCYYGRPSARQFDMAA